MLGKLNCYVARVGILLILVALVAGMAGCIGDGNYPPCPTPPPSQNLEIRDWYDLNDIRDNLAGNHTLMNDLDSATAGYAELASWTANQGNGWQPIGSIIADQSTNIIERVDPFVGTFDGQQYEIEDLFISRPNKDGVGLFGLVDYGGVIQNLGVMNAEVIGHSDVGSLVGCNDGTVSNSYSMGSVAGTGQFIAGLVGCNYGTVSDSYSRGSVTGYGVGGLVGARHGTVSNSYYDCDEVLINGRKVITVGALFGYDFRQWLANDKHLDVNERLSQENGYYLIDNVDDFKELLAFGQDGSLKFRLENDVDLATEPDFYIPYLAGEFDGNGHIILNLMLNSNLASPLGLFGYLPSGGKVTQLGVENINVTGYSGVGGLVGGTQEGTVSHSYSTGSVTGQDGVGGLVRGSNFGTVSDCYSSGSATGNSSVGGLVGGNGGTVDSSYSTSSVTGKDGVGGLVGSHGQGTVSNCYSTGSVTGNSDVGGLVGANYVLGTVRNSYSTGSVTGDECVGGLVGSNIDRGTVSNSYSTGSVTGNSHIGGLIGKKEGDGTVSDSFWDVQTSGQRTSAGGTGKTTTEMKDIATFTLAGWNIIAVAAPGTRNPTYTWNIVDGQTYPFLSWES